MKKLAAALCLSITGAASADSGMLAADPFINEAPFLRGSAWKPVVDVTGTLSTEAGHQLETKLTSLFDGYLKSAGVSTSPPSVVVSEERPGGVTVTRTYTPTLRVVIFTDDAASTCQVTAYDAIPATKAQGVVWQSPLNWSQYSADVRKAPLVNRLDGCVQWAARHFGATLKKAASQPDAKR